MMPERSVERDAAIAAMLPMVPIAGWTLANLVESSGRDADLLFPGGTRDLVECYIDRADRLMEADVAAFDFSGLGVTARVRTAIVVRLRRAGAEKDAVRRALGVLALPGHAVLAARCTARTVDAIWHAAGDTSADFSWYTKRALLAGVYGTTLLYWLQDGSQDDQDTLAFLDRRLAGVGQIGRMRRRFTSR